MASSDWATQLPLPFHATIAAAVRPFSGDYLRIPRIDDPSTCVCGADAATDFTEHDRRHSDYVRSLGHLLAPATLSAPR